MRKLVILLCSCLWITGCRSALEFSVDRYDIDFPRDASGESPARQEYNRVHPKTPILTLRSAIAAVDETTAAVKRYQAFILALNRAMAVFTTAEGDDPAKRIEALDSNINAEFQRIYRLLEAQRDEYAGFEKRHGGHFVAPLADAALIAELTLFPNALRNKKIASDADAFIQELRDLEADPEIGNKVIKKRVAAANKTIAKIAEEYPGLSTSAPELQKLAAALKGDPAARDAQVRAQAAEVIAGVDTSVDRLRGGDLVPRLHECFQDLSDPFVGYLATHPENWQALPNHGRVEGDGDTEYIIVFENCLDGRFKSVSVDPTKVIAARLRIFRKVAQAAVAVGGLAVTGMTGIPVPALAPGSADQSKDLDYSRMTGETELAKARIESYRRSIKSLKDAANAALLELARTDARGEVARRIFRQMQVRTTGAMKPTEK
jgi:hypothetical protein